MSGLHVGIIMDGNGRWARSQGKPRWRGHVAGVESVRDIVRGAPDLGVTTLTLYAFSSDNWKRPSMEVSRLFWLLREYCARERQELIDNGARVTHVGRRDRIPGSALAELDRTVSATAGGRRLNLRLAIDYSARGEIARAASALAVAVQAGHLDPADITADRMRETLAGDVPDVDLIVRTAGEQRLSDFLLWESAYAEFYYSTVLWPDFRRSDLAVALSEFGGRERRFGALTPIDASRELAAG
jgi:undecaprenyl diphosphate synthase